MAIQGQTNFRNIAFTLASITLTMPALLDPILRRSGSPIERADSTIFLSRSSERIQLL